MKNSIFRRDALRYGLGGAMLGAGAAIGLTCGENISTRGYPILDAHIHIPSDAGDIWQWHPVMKTMEDVVAYLDRVGIDRGIINSVHAIKSTKPEDFITGNREVLRYCDEYRGRFLPGIIINGNFPDESIRELEECNEDHGAVWIGELCNYATNPRYAYDSEGMDRVIRRAIDLNMVLHMHSQTKELEIHVARYPDAQLVIPHFGRSVDEIFQRIDLIAGHPKACFEISASGFERMGIMEYAVKTIGEDRIIFGSDMTINDAASVIARVDHAFLTNQQKEKILHLNTERLLAEAMV